MLQAIWDKLKAGLRYLSPAANAIQDQLSKDDVKRVLTRASISFATGTGLMWDRIEAAFLRDAGVIEAFWVPTCFAILTAIGNGLTFYAHGEKKDAKPPEGQGPQP